MQLAAFELRAGQKNIAGVVAAHLASVRMGQAAENRDLIAQWLQRLEAVVELKVAALAFGEPIPIRVLVIFVGQADPIGEIHGGKAARLLRRLRGGIHAGEEGEREGDPRSLEEGSAVEMPGFLHRLRLFSHKRLTCDNVFNQLSQVVIILREALCQRVHGLRVAQFQ